MEEEEWKIDTFELYVDITWLSDKSQYQLSTPSEHWQTLTITIYLFRATWHVLQQMETCVNW